MPAFRQRQKSRQGTEYAAAVLERRQIGEQWRGLAGRVQHGNQVFREPHGGVRNIARRKQAEMRKRGDHLQARNKVISVEVVFFDAEAPQVAA